MEVLKSICLTFLLAVFLTPANAKESQLPKSDKNNKIILGDEIKNVTLKISGQLNQDMFYVTDGTDDYFFYGDNEVSASVIKFSSVAKMTDDFNAFSNIEIGLSDQSSQLVSQINQSPGLNLVIRWAEAGLDFRCYGKFSLGQGSTASDKTAEVDLSGTDVALNSAVQKMGGGLIFTNTFDGSLIGNPNVGRVIDNLDGLSRLTRFRYDSPKISGFQLSGSLIQQKNADIALRYEDTFPELKISAAIAYETNSTIRNNIPGSAIDGSASLLLNNGFNATLAFGEVNADDPLQEDPFYYFVKLGYQFRLFTVGKTHSSIDFGRFSDYDINGDRASVLGGALVQNLKDWNTDLYLGYRQFKLTRPGESFNKIHLVLTGIRVKF